MKRAINFNAGPAAIPTAVLEEAQAELLDFAGTGMSIMEHSHRGKDYEKLHNETVALMKEMLGVGENYKVLFMGGGASTQFALIPMNFLHDAPAADYLVTGHWSKAAVKEAKLFGQVNFAANTEVNGKFIRVPTQDEIHETPGAAYVHMTTNNTIFGTQWHYVPKTEAPLIADMSSDMLWKPTDGNQYAMIYAGAQKNLGPSGVTVVVIRDDLLARCKTGLPTMFNYQTHATNNSLYNTPPTFAIYLVGKTLKWIKGQGGLEAVEKVNRAKGALLYGCMEKYPEFYRGPVDKDSRSYMNIVWRLPTEQLEEAFLAEAKKAGMSGLKGHRSVGGLRASTYNAVSLEWVQALVDLMEDFIKRNG